MRAIITHDLYTFYPLLEVHICSVTFGLMYGYYSIVVSNQEQVDESKVQKNKKIFREIVEGILFLTYRFLNLKFFFTLVQISQKGVKSLPFSIFFRWIDLA